MTTRRDKGVKTYGRHRNRVIVSDFWLTDSDKKKNIFGSSSENDSSKQSSLFHISSSSSEQNSPSFNSSNNSTDPLFEKQKSWTRPKQKKHVDDDKENEAGKHKGRSTRQTVKQTSLSTKTSCPLHGYNSSLDFSSKSSVSRNSTNTSLDKTNRNDRFLMSESQKLSSRQLRNRSQKIDYNDSANLQKQLKGVTGKRKRPIRKCVVQSEGKEPSMNFSDFDDYSLIILENSADKRNEEPCVATSTPLAKRTRKQFVINNSNVSHINVVVSPPSDSYCTPIDSPHGLSDVNNCCSPSLFDATSKSSELNKNSDSADKLTEEKTLKCSVPLKRITESFIDRHTSSGDKRTSSAKQTRNGLIRSNLRQKVKDFNESDSLFSTPGDYCKNNVRMLISRLQQISFIENDGEGLDEEEDDNDIERIIKKYQDESEGEESDTEEEEEEEESEIVEELSALIEENHSESEETEKEDSEPTLNTRVTRGAKYHINSVKIHRQDEEEHACRTADEEETEEEEDDDDDDDDDDSDEDDDHSDEESTGVHKLNLRRLNRSLQNNRISLRSHTSCRKKNSAIKTVKENLSGMDISELGNSRYMLNENDDSGADYKANSSLELSCERVSDNSKYVTASSPDIVGNGKDRSKAEHSEGEDDDHASEGDYEEENEDYHTAKDISSTESLENQKTPKVRKYSLRDRYEALKDSFSEMLTPTKKKGSLVPVPAKTKVMILCDQTEPVSFMSALTRSGLNKCKKIGEGVYGEVFQSTINNQSVAIKIIPIEGDFLVNDEPQKKFDEILPEIVIAKELSDLRFSEKSLTFTFCEVNSVSCVRGKYPPTLLKKWDEYNKAKHSENDRPDMFQDDQLFIVFEFADCGTALESFKIDNLRQAKTILTQVTFALAAAEEALQFEHRDLHWGNVLVRPTDAEEITFKLIGQEFRVPTMGVEASIIDFTLSRLTKDGCKVYSDLSKDDTLFEGKGDYQFDVYRMMKKENGNNWEKFCPFTNVVWLHYLADKLVYYNSANLKSRQEREIVREFKQFMASMLDYESALEMAVNALFLNS